MITHSGGRHPQLAAWPRQRGAAGLRWTAVLYGAAWLVHTADHLRRGTDVVTTEVLVLGTMVGVLQLVAIGSVLTRQRLAPMLAVAVGVPDGIGIAAVHLLPKWSSLSDAFPGAHATGVTGLSWAAAIAEIAGALSFAAAGWYVWHRTPTTAGT